MLFSIDKSAKMSAPVSRSMLTMLSVITAFSLSNCSLESKELMTKENQKNKIEIEEARANYKSQLEKMTQNMSLPNKLALTLIYMGPENKEKALQKIESNWSEIYLKRLIEVILYTDEMTRKEIVSLMERATGKKFGRDIDKWYTYLWSKSPEENDPTYYQFKALLYSQLDPRFIEYFQDNPNRTIRLDEIRWGGVIRDGIPPLRNPTMIDANKATYLEPDNIIFGITVNGDTRAYPKRILAWHEMFTDTIGGTPVAGVYCTLCGSMIPYISKNKDQTIKLGTSGFLYRSNKLMYDQKTKSMWSTIEGKPCVGKLVGKNIKLDVLPVVTTTWEKWKRKHPDTKVLSTETGFTRDYGEGIAYKDYFATDKLMFITPSQDNRLKNKAAVLALRWGKATQSKPLVYAKDFLSNNPIVNGTFREVPYVIITDKVGTCRVYKSNTEFKDWIDDNTVKDKSGKKWEIKEDALVNKESKERLARLPTHEAFWFGWYAAHPDTKLVK